MKIIKFNKFFQKLCLNTFIFLKFNSVSLVDLNNSSLVLNNNYFYLFSNFYNFSILLIFLCTKKYFLFIKFIFFKIYTNYFYFKNFYYLRYKFFKFFTFIGLGFKKRLFPTFISNYFFLYFGHRHWVIFFMPRNLFFYLIKRKNLVILSKTKYLLQFFLNNFKSFCKENFFKLKGMLDIRLRRRWVFMRRVKIRGLKIKLSKKQKFL